MAMLISAWSPFDTRLALRTDSDPGLPVNAKLRGIITTLFRLPLVVLPDRSHQGESVAVLTLQH
jgi:hypothetical protein